ncbi:MAG: hypothetical protein BWY82_01451 [Verrucomicrobia bacterium ADurb.Bin474]|nr:MAG: hypothetical protein BWY82_01451 [Verrucomicrobia bacterium ADurb.Bin474]
MSPISVEIMWPASSVMAKNERTAIPNSRPTRHSPMARKKMPHTEVTVGSDGMSGPVIMEATSRMKMMLICPGMKRILNKGIM